MNLHLESVAFYNGHFYPTDQLPIQPLNRSFLYGDSLFETIILRKGVICYLPDHIARLHAGCEVLQLEWPAELNLQSMEVLLQELVQRNGLTGDVRFRWQVWRASGGRFIPESHGSEHLITAEEQPPFEVKFKRAGVYEEVKVQQSSLSGFKTGNCLPYVLAGLECQKRNVDEIILLGSRHEVAEATSSNIFWVKGRQVFTPSLMTGCINGVMRKHVIEWCNANGWPVTKGRYSVADVQEAECAFTTNIAGIHYLTEVEGQPLPAPHRLVDELIQVLLEGLPGYSGFPEVEVEVS